jgi:hypothetical protein
MSQYYPERIVCISGFTVRPPRARREKPKVAAFTSAKIHQIFDLAPNTSMNARAGSRSVALKTGRYLK